MLHILTRIRNQRMVKITELKINSTTKKKVTEVIPLYKGFSSLLTTIKLRLLGLYIKWL